MKVNATKLAELYGKDRRTITNWINADPPCPSEQSGRERMFNTAQVAVWHAGRAVRDAVDEIQKQKPTDEADARKRKLMAEAILAEIAVREKEAELLPRAVIEEVVGSMADRLRAVAINAPSNYTLDLERAGVDAATAQAVLEKIAADLTRALRDSADDQVVEIDDAA